MLDVIVPCFSSSFDAWISQLAIHEWIVTSYGVANLRYWPVAFQQVFANPLVYQTLTGKSGGYKLAFITRVQAADNLEVTMGKLYTSLGTGNWEGSTAGQWFPFTNPPTSASIYLIKLSPSRTAYRPPKGQTWDPRKFQENSHVQICMY